MPSYKNILKEFITSKEKSDSSEEKKVQISKKQYSKNIGYDSEV